jgi:hypothetical protein
MISCGERLHKYPQMFADPSAEHFSNFYQGYGRSNRVQVDPKSHKQEKKVDKSKPSFAKKVLQMGVPPNKMIQLIN